MKNLPLTLALILSALWAGHSMAGHHKKGAIEVDMPLCARASAGAQYERSIFDS